MKQNYVALGVIALSAALACGEGRKSIAEDEPVAEDKQASKNFVNEVQTLEIVTEISFEDAKKDESLRSNYISNKASKVVEEFEQKYGISGFVSQVIYDPEFRKLDFLIEEFIRTEDAQLINKFRAVLFDTKRHRETSIKNVAMTFCKEDIGYRTPSNIYLSELSFQENQISSEEDLLSVIEHEAVHALLNYNGIPLDENCAHFLGRITSINAGAGLTVAIQETIACQMQFDNVRNGKRKVSEMFKRHLLEKYRRNYSDLEYYANLNDDSSDCLLAKTVICSIPSPPQ